LIEQAKQGNVPAARELLDVLGRAAPAPEEQQQQAFCWTCYVATKYGPGAPIDAV
jgi:hypothetical protein